MLYCTIATTAQTLLTAKHAFGATGIRDMRVPIRAGRCIGKTLVIGTVATEWLLSTESAPMLGLPCARELLVLVATPSDVSGMLTMIMEMMRKSKAHLEQCIGVECVSSHILLSNDSSGQRVFISSSGDIGSYIGSGIRSEPCEPDLAIVDEYTSFSGEQMREICKLCTPTLLVGTPASDAVPELGDLRIISSHRVGKTAPAPAPAPAPTAAPAPPPMGTGGIAPDLSSKVEALRERVRQLVIELVDIHADLSRLAQK